MGWVYSAISLSQEGEGVSLGAGSPWLGVFAQVLFKVFTCVGSSIFSFFFTGDISPK
jgi:hypothetical protein